MIESNRYEKKSILGSWIATSNGYKYQETTLRYEWDRTLGCYVKASESTILKEPTEAGLCRSTIINVLFCKEYTDLDQWNGKKTVWFKQSMTYQLRNDQTENIWLMPHEGKLYIKDLANQGMLTEVALGESTVNYICKIGKPVKIESLEEANELAKTTKYVFNRIESDGKDITAYITTV
jgi:hypothetical protein